MAVLYSCAACGSIFFRVADVWLPGVADRHTESVRRLMVEIEVHTHTLAHAHCAVTYLCGRAAARSTWDDWWRTRHTCSTQRYTPH